MKRVLSILMIFCLSLCLVLPVCAASDQQVLQSTYETMRPALILIYVILAVLAISCVLFTIGAVNARKSKRRKKNPGMTVLRIVLYLVTVIVLLCAVFCTIRYTQLGNELNPKPVKPDKPSSSVTDNKDDPTSDDPTDPDPTVEDPSEDVTEPPTEPPFVLPTLSPSMTADTDPANWNLNWQLQVDGNTVDAYQSPDTYNFTAAEDYYPLPGVPTFRGNNYRTGASYGTANISQQTITKNWCREVGSLNGWPGIGWTGQSLCVQWDEQTKQHMNLYANKKSKEGLVEVISTTLDGYIYFYDMDDGTYTRDPLWIGMSFKGTASLDPRGYPILYAGSGLDYGSKSPRMFIINLLDCSLLMEQTGWDTFSHRGWYAFDSSPMISGETDTLFWPGESGIIYSIKLNTQYDQAAGTLDMQPEIMVKTRYSTNRDRTVGFEASAIMVGNHMFIGDNGGMFFCIDLHTMSVVWAQDVKDDVNATPVFEWGEDGQGYLYVGSSTQYTGNAAYIHKLNAATGEIIWTREYGNVAYDEDVSGGILSSPVLGQKGTDLEGMIIYAIAKTPGAWSGTFVALDTETGNTVWEKSMGNYAWSSPVTMYTPSGKGYILIGDSAGYLHLVNGATGETLYTEGLGSNIEASPVVFENKLVVGTRGCQVWGIEVK